MTTAGERRRARGASSAAGSLLAWAVIVVAAFVVATAVVVPRVAGGTPYAVLTGSMRPDLPPGSLVVVRPVEPAQVRVGDVVTVQLRSGREGYVTHRVVEVLQGLDGTTSFRTQGDANAAADADLRRPEQIRGRLWYSVPYVGRVSTALTGAQRGTAVQVVAGALLLYATWMFAGAARARRRGTAASTRVDDEEKEEVAP